jgi:hypothetical protein
MNPRVIDLPAPPTAQPEESEPEPPSPLVASYRKQLVEASRLDTPDGQRVMHLAALFALGKHTASGAASLSRELHAAMEVALRGSKKTADAMDELAERRRFKASSA